MAEKLTREELIKLVEKMCNGEGSDDEIGEWIEILEKNIQDPNVSDLIYFNNEKLTPEQIVDRAMNYKPRILP